MTTITHLIKTFTAARHAELVSASMPRWWSEADNIKFGSGIEAWALKQVQGDIGVIV